MDSREIIKMQIIEYMKMYVPDGEPIGAEKIMRLFDKQRVTCLMCNGVGEIECGNDKKEQLKLMAQQLRSKGVTIRKIASTLGFNHPGSVTHLLKK